MLKNHTLKLHVLLALPLVLLSASCGRNNRQPLDPLLRAKVDGLNKASFQSRCRDPRKGIFWADSALTLINDSLPNYADGILRASNNRAYCAYMLSDFDQAEAWLVDDDSAEFAQAPNFEVEQLISRLLRARMAQRHCNIAQSYQILHDIDRSRVLSNSGTDFLHNFALTEYYITSLTLNYHYRNGTMAEMTDLLDEIEQLRPQLKCDFAQDMALNYSLAYSYFRLCDTASNQSATLRKVLNYCADNIEILSSPNRFNSYELANACQMIAFALADSSIVPQSWADNEDMLGYIFSLLESNFNYVPADTADLAMSLFRESASLFFQLDDPYQHLGAVVATAQYALEVGDTALAQTYYSLILNDTARVNPYAPKFESMLFQGLINSHYSSNPAEVAQWFNRELQILSFISQNEKADFILQNELTEVKAQNRVYLALFGAIAALIVVLVGILLLLRRRTRLLRIETRQLQEAKQQDVERIANVETCLSVLRHDINPFISYLRNKNIPEDLKSEVVEQLIRTFENIKNWTNLTIPSGMRFRQSVVPLNEVFLTVISHAAPHDAQLLSVISEPTPLAVQADRQLLEILLRNLLNNAIQHTAQGTVTLSAEVNPDDSRFALISVTDTGEGMTAEQLENLFRSDKPLPADGNSRGFGLILCRNIIKKHDDNTLQGCRIWAESRVGEGSVFHFLLALANNDNDNNK